jgi:hypothetical protein
MTEYVKVDWMSKNASSWVDVTSYVVGTNRCSLGKGSKIQKGGVITFDDTLQYTIEPHDAIKLSIYDGTTTRFFEGFFIEPATEDDDYSWRFEHYERLPSIRKATNVYTALTDIEIFKALVDEYLVEFTYDDTSIPPETLDDRDMRLNAVLISDVFDGIAQRTGRNWWVDDDKKIWLKELTFTASGYTITASEIHGRPRVVQDTSNWRTKVRVEGERTETAYQKDFSVGGATGTTSWTLDQAYASIEVKQIPSGSDEAAVAPKRVILEGSDVESDVVDFYWNPATKVLTRNTARVTLSVNDTIRVKGFTVSQVVGEAVNPTAYAKYGLIEGRTEVNRLITSDSQAETIAQSLADEQGEPVSIPTFATVWDSRVLPGNSITMNAYGIAGSYNVVELLIEWAGNSTPAYHVTLNNFNYTFDNEFDELERRVRQLEDRDLDAQTFVKKTYFPFANIAVDLYRVYVHDYGITNAFTLDQSYTALDTAGDYLDGNDGGGSLRDDGVLYVWNPNDKVRLFLNNDEDWDTGGSTATLSTTNCTITF